MEKKFPIRINKYLAEEKHSTRRGADELIAQGQVLVNGRPAELGEMINEGDKVEVRYRAGKKKTYTYLAYHKPRGVMTHSAEAGEREIRDQVSVKGVFPIGRLDKDSSGLILLTDDGRVTKRLLGPEYSHEKEYVVATKGKLPADFKAKMEAGLEIGQGERTRPCKVEILGDNQFKITLTEGKNRQIRRMCAALFQEVDTLERIRIMNIALGNLRENEYRPIEGEELATLLAALGL